MKNALVALALALLVAHSQADEEHVLSTSPDGAFELVAIKHVGPEYEEYALRNTTTKKLVSTPEDIEDDYINPGFGSPHVDWSPDSRMLIISAKLYRHLGEFSAVFRITGDQLVHVALPRDSEPARWNPGGTLVLRVKREESYRFDSAKQTFVPYAKGERPK